MKDRIVQKRERAFRRAQRVRARVHGTAERPRLTIKRSLKHMSAQLIDDVVGRTLVAASDQQAVREKGKGRVITASVVGTLLGEKAVKAGIMRAVVDRGAYRYHGRVQALIEAAQKAGLSYTN
ncbi:MAG: 50S ribosomal protein L18 [Patescibacteria group bacterium]